MESFIHAYIVVITALQLIILAMTVMFNDKEQGLNDHMFIIFNQYSIFYSCNILMYVFIVSEFNTSFIIAGVTNGLSLLIHIYIMIVRINENELQDECNPTRYQLDNKRELELSRIRIDLLERTNEIEKEYGVPSSILYLDTFLSYYITDDFKRECPNSYQNHLDLLKDEIYISKEVLNEYYSDNQLIKSLN